MDNQCFTPLPDDETRNTEEQIRHQGEKENNNGKNCVNFKFAYYSGHKRVNSATPNKTRQNIAPNPRPKSVLNKSFICAQVKPDTGFTFNTFAKLYSINGGEKLEGRNQMQSVNTLDVEAPSDITQDRLFAESNQSNIANLPYENVTFNKEKENHGPSMRGTKTSLLFDRQNDKRFVYVFAPVRTITTDKKKQFMMDLKIRGKTYDNNNTENIQFRATASNSLFKPRNTSGKWKAQSNHVRSRTMTNQKQASSTQTPFRLPNQRNSLAATKYNMLQLDKIRGDDYDTKSDDSTLREYIKTTSNNKIFA